MLSSVLVPGDMAQFKICKATYDAKDFIDLSESVDYRIGSVLLVQ